MVVDVVMNEREDSAVVHLSDGAIGKLVSKLLR